MTEFREPRRVALETAMRTGFIRLEIFSLALWALHEIIIAYYLLEGKRLLRRIRAFESHPQKLTGFDSHP